LEAEDKRRAVHFFSNKVFRATPIADMSQQQKRGESMIYIYGLHDPVRDSIFYVGKSANPNTRLGAHIAAALEVAKSQRILDILKAGEKPGIQIFQEVPSSMASVKDFVRSQEAKWINAFGDQLVNRARWDMPSAMKDFSRLPSTT
jgi:hypothetical protein